MKGSAGLLRRTTAVATLLAFVPIAAPPGSAGVAIAQQPASRPTESSIKIDHEELKCVVTDFAPKVDASVAPGQILDKGYVYFRAAGTEDFYYAPMRGRPELLEGVLPRPLPETKSIDYYLRALDRQALAKREPRSTEHTPPVVPGNSCKDKGVAVGKDGANLTIGLTKPGQNPVPPGFNRKDIAFVILASGATVTLAEALGGTTTGQQPSKGGGKTGAYVGAGLLVAGAAIAIASNDNASVSTATPTPPPTATPTRTATATAVPLRFIQADATWSGEGNVDVRILNAADQSVGTNLPAGCGTTSARTERVILQGAVPPGNYRVELRGLSCGAGTPLAIAVAVSVQSETGPKCSNTFLNVPVGSGMSPGPPVITCPFAVP